MELQDRTIRVRKMILALIRRTIAPKFRFVNEDSVGMYLEKGLKELPSVFGLTEIGEERIVDYIVYQIYRMRGNIEKGAWQSTWLFSQYARDKFKKQFFSEDGKTGINYYINLWLEEAELNRGILVKSITAKKPSPLLAKVYLENEEWIKQRFLNKDGGMEFCVSHTTGWTPASSTCQRCDSRTQCEQITALKYPELVRLRKESYHGKKE